MEDDKGNSGQSVAPGVDPQDVYDVRDLLSRDEDDEASAGADR